VDAATRILIVDDDEAFAESNRDLLEAYGYEVRIAHDGQSGLAEARAFRPALIVLDVMMATDTEGFEVARKIPETPELRGVKVLLVTGMAKELGIANRLRPDATWLPVERVLEKPIGPQRLMAEVERALGKKG
jgi:two-component system, OmpR family, alkaline phosphatase synthesis response regulator PhoP